MRNQKGQVVLILILVMTVALAIGLSVIQRSLSDISTSTRVEESSRAFSAAEAGIEKAIQEVSQGNYIPISSFNLDNNATVQGVDKNLVPTAGQALEYPALVKEELAHVWLANPDTLDTLYNQPSFNLYFGQPDTTDKPAVEVTVISWDGSNYVPTKRFFDSDANRASSNGFTPVTCNNPTVRTNANTTDSQFYCMTPVSGYPLPPAKAILARIRLLYSSKGQPVAVAPTSGSLPVQARIFTSTGIAGVTQRKVQVLRLDKVVPPYFDYAIFSAGDINK